MALPFKKQKKKAFLNDVCLYYSYYCSKLEKLQSFKSKQALKNIVFTENTRLFSTRLRILDQREMLK